MSYEIAAGGTFGVEYDNLGRTTSLPAKYSGGGKLETTYYVNDLTRSQTQDGITNTYELDAGLRQRERVRTGGSEAGTEIYHYANGSDSPAWVDKGEGDWTRFIGGLGAMAIEDSATEEVTLQLADLHGDIVATADIDPEATELLSTQEFDEYGNPKGETTPKLGWLGSKLRRTELPSGVIQMGVRSYVPELGRFLSPDPIKGGSANAYEYAGGDPINNFDLTGECYVTRRPSPGRCKNRDRGRRKKGRNRGRGNRRRQRRPSNATRRIVSSLKDIAGVAAPIAWGTRVPQSEVGPVKRAGAALGGSSYIPKVHYDVSSPAEFSAAKATGWAWCVVTNAWATNPVRGALGWAGMTAAFGGFCGGERAWAYVHVT